MKPSSRNQTAADIADALDVHEDTVWNWSKSGCPHTRNKRTRAVRYSLEEVAAWLKSTGRSTRPGRPRSEGSREMLAAKIRKENALADLYEGQYRRAAARLLDADDVHREWDRITATIRAAVEPLGATTAPLMFGKTIPEIQSILDAAVRDTLRRLSESADLIDPPTPAAPSRAAQPQEP
ncbi:MAG: helix-turn-helix domain-containing protein [Planctomycetes bacterium]|nr:helix-turn-helix domain-containing protein [Planctomycetota bacterium]